MKYYVFADDSDTINTFVKNANFTGDNYEEALEYFNNLNKKYKYSNSYLIIDFEFKHSSMFGAESLDDLKNCIIVPFLIIREFHYDKNTMISSATGPDGRINNNLTIRHDSIVIESSGFAQEFDNNDKALGKFLYCINNSIPAVMSLMFVDNKTGINYKRKIASSIEVLRDKAIPIKKIKISRHKNVTKYILPKYKAYNFTVQNINEISIGG